ncbi:MAG: hypothetical protein AB7W16_15040 [Candidatus Obscuribacterales bacterium]
MAANGQGSEHVENRPPAEVASGGAAADISTHAWSAIGDGALKVDQARTDLSSGTLDLGQGNLYGDSQPGSLAGSVRPDHIASKDLAETYISSDRSVQVARLEPGYTGALDRNGVPTKLDSAGIKATQDIALDDTVSDADRTRSLQVLLSNDVQSFQREEQTYKIETIQNGDLQTLSLKKSGPSDTEQVELFRSPVENQLSDNPTRSVNPPGEPVSDVQNEKEGEPKAPEQEKTPQEKLFDPSVSPEDKLKAAQELAKQGATEVTGPDGKKYQISTQKVGNRDLVSIFGADDAGKSHPMLRGIVNQDGTVSKQRDSKGNEVDYQGTWAQKHAQDNPMVKYEPKPETEEHPDQPGEPTEKPDVDKSREHLRESAEQNITDPEARKEFLENMRKFEARARQQGLSEEEIAKTFDQTSRLLDAKEGKVSPENRVLAARGLARHLAEPSGMDQGYHNTCGATSLGERTMTRHPSQAAEMVASAAIDGKWTAPDGKVIEIPPQNLTPGVEERTYPPVDDDRTFATQLLNSAMINDSTQRRMPPEYYVQGRPTGDGDTGERLIYKGQKPEDGRTFDGQTAPELAEEAKRINGDQNAIMQDPDIDSGDNVVRITSREDLDRALADAKKNGNMPLIVFVDTADPIFGGDGTGPNRYHFVSITDYDPETGQVKMSNQWGPQNDKTVSLDDLFRAIKHRTPEEKKED